MSVLGRNALVWYVTDWVHYDTDTDTDTEVSNVISVKQSGMCVRFVYVSPALTAATERMRVFLHALQLWGLFFIMLAI